MRALDLLRRIAERVTSEELVLQEPSGDADAVVAPAVTVALLKRTGSEIVDEAAQLESLVAGLPESEIRVTPASVRVGAAAQLADGILDVRTVLLAASVLPVDEGWRALASALRTSDAHEFWSETTVADVLGRFRGAKPAVAGRLLHEAQIDPSALWPSLPAASVARLAGLLERANGPASQ
jgi:hypothetical protein